MRHTGACMKLVFSGAMSSEVLSVVPTVNLCLIWSVGHDTTGKTAGGRILSVVGMEHRQPLLGMEC